MSGSFLVYSARSGTIKCPGSEVACIVDCNQYGCLGTRFNTHNDTVLDITVHGLRALESSIIYCPIAVRNCRITVESGSDVFTNSKIYAIAEPVLNVACDGGNCYDASNPPQIYCLNNYLVACMLTIDSGVNHWQCRDNQVLVDLCLFPTQEPTTDPTTDPTPDPTTDPTTPTTDPTVNPAQFDPILSTEYVVSDISTYYNVSISLNCDESGDDELDCDDLSDDLDEIMVKLLFALYEDAELDGVDIKPEIADVQITGDEVVVRLAVETRADQQLEADYIRHHIEREVEEDDRFGDVEVEIEGTSGEDEDEQLNSPSLDIETWPMLVVLIVAFFASFVVYMCGTLCFYCIRKKMQNSRNAEAQLMNMTAGAPAQRDSVSDMHGTTHDGEEMKDGEEVTVPNTELMQTDSIVLPAAALPKDDWQQMIEVKQPGSEMNVLPKDDETSTDEESLYDEVDHEVNALPEDGVMIDAEGKGNVLPKND
eukprot:674929_1